MRAASCLETGPLRTRGTSGSNLLPSSGESSANLIFGDESIDDRSAQSLIHRRIRFLSKRLESAEVVDPNQQRNRDQVFFGATVTYANGRGIEMTITIVGIDEAELDRGQVSWLSPIARALMKAHQGDIVDLRAPAGSIRSRCSPSATVSPPTARHVVGLAFSASGLPAACLARLR